MAYKCTMYSDDYNYLEKYGTKINQQSLNRIPTIQCNSSVVTCVAMHTTIVASIIWMINYVGCEPNIIKGRDCFKLKHF